VYRVINKTNQTIILEGVGFVEGYKEVITKELSPQINNLVKKGLLAVRKG